MVCLGVGFFLTFIVQRSAFVRAVNMCLPPPFLCSVGGRGTCLDYIGHNDIGHDDVVLDSMKPAIHLWGHRCV